MLIVVNGWDSDDFQFIFGVMIPHEFVLEMLYPLPYRTKRMFGVLAVYVGEKIVLALRQKQDNPGDNGIWIGTKVEHHSSLKELFPSLRNLEVYKIKTWLLLPEDAEDFEESALRISELIKKNSPLIGNIPPPRKSKQRK